MGRHCGKLVRVGNLGANVRSVTSGMLRSRCGAKNQVVESSINLGNFWKETFGKDIFFFQKYTLEHNLAILCLSLCMSILFGQLFQTCGIFYSHFWQETWRIRQILGRISSQHRLGPQLQWHQMMVMAIWATWRHVFHACICKASHVRGKNHCNKLKDGGAQIALLVLWVAVVLHKMNYLLDVAVSSWLQCVDLFPLCTYSSNNSDHIFCCLRLW